MTVSLDLTGIDLGNVPAWVSATVTSFAFAVAARSYSRNVKQRKEEQARLVYSKVLMQRHFGGGETFDPLPDESKIGIRGGGSIIMFNETRKEVAVEPIIQLTVAVHNGSKELIGPAKLQVINKGRGQRYEDFAALIGVIDPESEYVVNFIWPNLDHPGQPSLDATLIFRDASGQWWRREMAEPIEAVHADPENFSPTKTELAQSADNARKMGLTPSPPSRVPVRARFHRGIRRLRGKTPIP